MDRSGRAKETVHAGREKLDPVVRIERLQATKRARTYWLTIGKGGTCEGCLLPVAGVPIAYRHRPKSVVCRACADTHGVVYEVSGTWMRHVAAQKRAA